MTARRALITGVTGQDGSYLAELLIDKGYEVHALIRQSAIGADAALAAAGIGAEYAERIIVHRGDLGESSRIREVIESSQAGEIYNLASQSHVHASFEQPEYTGDVTGLEVTRLLEAVRRTNTEIRVYQAGSSEMFGEAPAPQSESTPFNPRSPYAISKVYAHWMGRLYRDAYGMYVTNGILFNHESPRRGPEFVTRKISLAAARIKMGLQSHIALGNLEARRDWGYAPEYVTAMWSMMQQDTPDDYVIATGASHSVRDFATAAFARLGLEFDQYCIEDAAMRRPADLRLITGDASKALSKLGWKAQTTGTDVAVIMADADFEELARHHDPTRRA